ncbi:DUF3394 domain-containing protein, partial [Escherichia coli]|uniref:DUF3394 domain-containing protein n=1 Tax=Escherichia coli TaxID=562 RepID=UPI003FA5467E
VSGGKPIGTGIIAFKYALRTALLPFLFIFNSDLLLINVGVAQGIFIFVIATLAMLIFTAATQGYLIVKSKWWESALLLLIAFSIFRPGFWIDKVVESHHYVAMSDFIEQGNTIQSGAPLRIHVTEEDYSGEPANSTHM